MCFIANIERAPFSMNFTWTNLLGEAKSFQIFKSKYRMKPIETVAAKCKIVIELISR